MSKVTFLTSSSRLDFQSIELNEIIKNEHLTKKFPYLAPKKVIYGFDVNNKATYYKNFINAIQNYCYSYDCEIEIVTLWETDSETEIRQFNVNPKLIKITQLNDSKKYDLIYKLENNYLEPSTSYLITKE